MSKIIKVLAVLVVAVVVVVAVGGAIAFMYVDTIARRSIESGSTYALGVETSLDSADVGILTGTFSMAGLNIANPEGFDAPHFLRMGEGGVEVSYSTLAEEVVELPTLTISDLDVQLLKKDGKSNYAVILENLKRFESDEDKPAKPDDASSKRFVIRKVEIRNVNVHAELLPIGGSLTKAQSQVDLIELHDVGSGGESVGLAELMNIIVKAVLSASINKLGDVPDIQGELGAGLQSLTALSDQGVQVMMDVGGQLTDVTSDLSKNLEDVAQGVGEAAEEITRSAEDVQKTVEEAGEKLKDAIPNPFKKKEDENKDDGGGG